MALANMEFKRPKLVSFGKKEKREEKKKKRRRGRRWRSQDQASQEKYGTLDFWYGNYFEYEFCMDHMEF